MDELENLSQKYYLGCYKSIHYKGLLGAFTRKYHYKLEKGRTKEFSSTLEIGAGSGEHLSYVKHKFEKYYLLDPYPGDDLLSLASRDHKLEILTAFAEEIPLQNSSVDRIICTCVLLHVDSVNKSLSEFRRVAKPGAVLDLYLPMDPGMFYRYVRHFTSHMKTSKKMGTSMKETKFLWANEHKNHFLSLKSILTHLFKDDTVEIVRFPFPFLSWNFNLFAVAKIKINSNKT